MVNTLARTDWITIAWVAAIAISAILVYTRWIRAAVGRVDPARAALPDGGLRARGGWWPTPHSLARRRQHANGRSSSDSNDR
jgi:hypothetical protein